jgi:hypothetical protein
MARAQISPFYAPELTIAAAVVAAPDDGYARAAAALCPEQWPSR